MKNYDEETGEVLEYEKQEKDTAMELANQSMQIQQSKSGVVSMQMISENQMVARRDSIIKIMHSVMQEGVHYGKPYASADKNVLLKAGAEVLCNVFQLAPEYDVDIINMENYHREYRIKTRLRHIPTQNIVGEGLGSCSTLESKYRYRKIDESTGVAVPKEAWDFKNDKQYDKMRDCLEVALMEEGIDVPKEAEVGFTKENGNWEISIRGKGENPDIADQFNTCLKIAKKRSIVDGTITATGCSNLFTQDVDEFEDYEKKSENTNMTVEQMNHITELENSLTDKQASRLSAKMKKSDLTYEEADNFISLMKLMKELWWQYGQLDREDDSTPTVDEITDRVDNAKSSKEIKQIITEINNLKNS